jgi:hypothetical protein
MLSVACIAFFNVYNIFERPVKKSFYIFLVFLISKNEYANLILTKHDLAKLRLLAK